MDGRPRRPACPARSYIAFVASKRPRWTTESGLSASKVLLVPTSFPSTGVYISQIGLGGNPNEFLTLVLFDSFADIAKFPEAYAKAAAEAKLQPMVNGTVMNNEWRVYRYVPELSIIP